MGRKRASEAETGANARSLVALADQGDPLAARQLFDRLYGELHQLAKRQMYRHGASLSMDATTLLHEAYLKLSAMDDLVFPDEARFMGYAARAMRGLIIDYARNRQALKRGGAFAITSLSTNIAQDVADVADGEELARIGDALDAPRGRRAGAGAAGGPQVLLRVLLARHRHDARRVGAHGPARLGEGTHLPAATGVERRRKGWVNADVVRLGSRLRALLIPAARRLSGVFAPSFSVL